MTILELFMFYSMAFMALAMPIALLIFGLAISNVGLKAGDEWIKQREAKAKPAGAQPAAG